MSSSAPAIFHPCAPLVIFTNDPTMTTNNEQLLFGNPGGWITEVQPPVVLVTSAVPKPRAKGRALWNPFALRRLSRCAPFSPVEKESVEGWTVSETVSKRGGRVVKNSGELNQINIDFTGVFAILLKLNHAFRSQRDPAHLSPPTLKGFGFKIKSEPCYSGYHPPNHSHFSLPRRRADFCKWLIEQPKLYRFFTLFLFFAGGG